MALDDRPTRWRLRAEGLRGTADSMRESTAKKTLYDVARQWDKMADQVERIEVEMPTPDHEAPRRH